MAKVNFTDEELVAGYLASIVEGDGVNFWAYEEVTELIGTDPERAWRLTIQMLRQSENELAVATVAAGPLEDLLAWSGPEFINQAESLAVSEPRFRQALAMIYTTRLKPDIRGRVEQAIKGNA